MTPQEAINILSVGRTITANDIAEAQRVTDAANKLRAARSWAAQHGYSKLAISLVSYMDFDEICLDLQHWYRMGYKAPDEQVTKDMSELVRR